jgi:hypothetical protein
LIIIKAFGNRLNIPGALYGFFIIVLYAVFDYYLVDPHPGFMQTFVKVGSVTGKRVTLVAEIHLFLLVTGSHATTFKQFALFVPAAFTVSRRQVIQHLFESRILLKNRISQQGFKPFGIVLEISQFFLELQAVHADLSVHMGKAFFTTQAAWGNG